LYLYDGIGQTGDIFDVEIFPYELFFSNMFSHYRYLFFTPSMEVLYEYFSIFFIMFQFSFFPAEDIPIPFEILEGDFFEDYVSFENANEVYDY
jgi:hypothetical protein